MRPPIGDWKAPDMSAEARRWCPGREVGGLSDPPLDDCSDLLREDMVIRGGCGGKLRVSVMLAGNRIPDAEPRGQICRKGPIKLRKYSLSTVKAAETKNYLSNALEAR